MINQRQFDWYNIDTKKDLKIFNTCPRPFDTILIDKKGSCYACECTSWLPQSIGNLHLQPLSEIINSKMHQHLQESVTDNTYRYCNENQCSYIKSGAVQNVNNKQIKHLRLAIDDSCNLRCPSCREGLIFYSAFEDPRHNPKDLRLKQRVEEYKKRVKLADKINSWLVWEQNPIQVHIGSDGDPFASHIYRYFMEHTPKRNNIKYSILTNGLMFESYHTKIPHVINNLQELGVSVDGASKETYEILRKSAKWDNLNRNLEVIAKIKQEKGFRFILHFVIQKENYHEMEKMIDLGEQYGADRVWLNKIENWNTFDNWEEQNIFAPTHSDNVDYNLYLNTVLQRIWKRNDRFIECPTLISEEVRYKNKN